MLYLSELLIQHKELQNFGQLSELVRVQAQAGQLHFRMDVKPPFHDTPPDWEDRLEAAFTTRNR